jgi:hypothetical protein
VTSALRFGDPARFGVAISLPFGAGVALSFGKMERDVWLVTDNPTVMRYRGYVEELACSKLEHSTIIKCGGRCARQHQTDMFQMASRGANTRPNMFGSLPARPVRGSSNDEFANPNGFEFSLLELHDLIGLLEPLQNHLIHFSSSTASA